jgi:hypothetical protein
VTADDLLILVPWLLFGASIVTISVMSVRRRPRDCGNAADAAAGQRRPEMQITERDQAPSSPGPCAESDQAPRPGWRALVHRSRR